MVKILQIRNFSKKQFKVLNWWLGKDSTHDAIICDGAIRSGKTLCMSLSFILWSFFNSYNNSLKSLNKKVNFYAICGKTIRSARRNVISPILPYICQMGFRYKLHNSENIFEISYKNFRIVYYIFGGKDESSHGLIQGLTLSGILFDEVALMPKSFVEQALARCSENNSKFWFNCNPEHSEHWFFKEWILKKTLRNALYIHFTLDDNPGLSAKIKQRYKKLYFGQFYRRFIEGRWTKLDGLVYPFMNCSEMGCGPPSDENFTEFVISCDYGIVNPMSCGFWGNFQNSGIWYRLREYYYDSKIYNKTLTDEEHYVALKDLAGGKKITAVVVDPSAASFIALIKKKSDFLVIPAKNNVASGITQTISALKRGQIKICDTCKNSWKEFGLYRWDDNDKVIKENDHAMDDIRYFVATVLNKNIDINDDFCAFSVAR